MTEQIKDDFDTIERYFDGKLGKKERAGFEERLLVDPKFKTHYDCYAAMVEGIKEFRKQELRFYLKENTETIRERKTFFFGLLPYVLTILLIPGAVYFVTEKYIPQYSFPRVFNKVDSLIRAPYKAVERSSEEQLKKEFGRSRATTEKEPLVDEEEKIPKEDAQLSVDESLINSGASGAYIDLVEDEWLFDTTLAPGGMSQTTSDSIPAGSSVSWQDVNVEFWQSPLNSKGYQFNGKKLLLYGISPPYKIQLLSADDDLYLQYDKKYFYLDRDGRFHGYRELEPGLVKKILQR